MHALPQIQRSPWLAGVHLFSSRAPSPYRLCRHVPDDARTAQLYQSVSQNRGEQPCSIYRANAMKKKSCLCWMSYVRGKCIRMLLPTKSMVAHFVFKLNG